MSVKVRDTFGETTYLGMSKAIVIDNKDPDHKGKIRVLSPIFGSTPFIPFLTPDDGMFCPPDIGSVVYIEAGGGSSSYLIATKVINDGPDLNPDTPSDFQRDVPTNRGWVSPGSLNSEGKPDTNNSGHKIEFDDGIATTTNNSVTQTKENKGFRITTSGGHSIILMEEDTDGSQQNRIKIETKNGQKILLADSNDSETQKIILTDSEDRSIEILKDDNKIILKNGDSSIYIDLQFSVDTIETEASTIKIGKNAVEPIILGNQWVIYNNAEIVTKLNALIAAYETLNGNYGSHTHSYTDDGNPMTTGGPSSGGGASGLSTAGSAGSQQLAQKGVVE